MKARIAVQCICSLLLLCLSAAWPAQAQTVTGTGKPNFITKWTSSSKVGNSLLFQTPTGNIGVGLTNPISTLDVNGSARVRGLFKLPASGTANANQGFASQPYDQAASAFDSGLGLAVNQTFRWQAVPLGNDTPNTSAALSLAFGQGGNSPLPTGLSIASNGLINFVPGQAFPGTGTVSSVGTGQGLIGGPVTTTGTLSLDTTFTDGRYPQLRTANAFSGNQSIVGAVYANANSGPNAGSFTKGTLSVPATHAAVQVLNVTTDGEAAWIGHGNSGNPFPVLKLVEVSGSSAEFLSCQRPDSTQLCHIDKNGTFVSGSDFAEAIPARGERKLYEPGDVLVMGKDGDAVEKKGERYSHRIVGIYSTRPGVLGAEKGGSTRVDAADLPVAITGIVPTKVSAENGPVRVGDLLVSASTPGYAMRATDRKLTAGAVLGKALQPLSGQTGVISVLVMLR